MRDFQLTRVALTGARISTFYPYGYHARNQLNGHCVSPDTDGLALDQVSEQDLAARFRAQLPVWIHNILTDPEFPQRSKLLMPLRRFEGELYDNRENEVVSAVLTAGFRNHTLDPLDLPESMPMRQRCAIVMQADVWREAFRQLEHDLVTILVACSDEIDCWQESARQPRHALID